MGVFERDNVPFKGTNVEAFTLDPNEKQYKKVDAPALAVTDRMTPSEMLGGT